MYTKEEKKLINDTIKVILKDLREIYKLNERRQIISVFTLDVKKKKEVCKLIIKSQGIYIEKFSSNSYTSLDKYWLKDYSEDIDFEIRYKFILKYDEIREKILKDIKNQSKLADKDKLKELKEKYDPKKNMLNQKNIEIQVEMPETINKSSIEIIQEDGKNIGKINIGSVTIKILASKNIDIVTKKLKSKVKKKI